MKLIAPDYYPQFRCIADKCQHSCCIGWEIDIDPDARATYRAMTDPFGQRLNAAIEDGEDGASFRLDAEERCPMLNRSGLCDLITAKGEGALCQICADHPRFRNFFADRTEIGLGLCCEAAAALVLGQQEPVGFIVLEDGGHPDPDDVRERDVSALRSGCIAVMQDRTKLLAVRLAQLLDAVDTATPVTPDAALFRGLNRLNPAWDDVLALLGGEWTMLPELETALEQFGVYLLYRHLPGAVEGLDECERVRFCVLSVRMLAAICCGHAAKYGACSLADCVEYARMYSAEIEYDEDNVDALLDAMM